MVIRPDGAAAGKRASGTVGGWSAGGGDGHKRLRSLLTRRMQKNPGNMGRFGSLDELRQKLQALMQMKMDKRLAAGGMQGHPWNAPGTGGRPMAGPGGRPLMPFTAMGQPAPQAMDPAALLGAPQGSSWQGMFGVSSPEQALQSPNLTPEQKQQILAMLQAQKQQAPAPGYYPAPQGGMMYR